MKTCSDTLTKIQKNISEIERFPLISLDKAIFLHYELLSELYAKNKFFYKNVFKSHRFKLISLIVTEGLISHEPTFLNLYKNFLPINLMSKNSISSFFSFLVVSGRVKVWSSKEDKRKVVYGLTDKFKVEASNLLNTMLVPLNNLFKEEVISLEEFIKNFSPVVYGGYFDFESIKYAEIFIDRDAGHTIILNLYCNKIKIDEFKYKTLSVKELAERCGVSRSHIKKILFTAAEVGFVLNPGGEDGVLITEKFNSFALKYMIKYFSLSKIGLVR